MILFVDDEKRSVEPFMEELKHSDYKVHLETLVGPALDFFRANSEQVELLVLDIMMPHGDLLTAEDTEEGRRTGIRLFRKFRQENPKVPVIIFTNVSAEPVEEAFADQPRCRFLKKIDTFPFEFREEVAVLLGSAKGS